jgi:hypothetical protein
MASQLQNSKSASFCATVAMSRHYRLGAETEPTFSTDSSVPTYKRNEVFEREWAQWNRKTGLQRYGLVLLHVVSLTGRVRVGGKI